MNNTFVAGPEGGVKYFVNSTTFVQFNVNYQFFFDNDTDSAATRSRTASSSTRWASASAGTKPGGKTSHRRTRYKKRRPKGRRFLLRPDLPTGRRARRTRRTSWTSRPSRASAPRGFEHHLAVADPRGRPVNVTFGRVFPSRLQATGSAWDRLPDDESHPLGPFGLHRRISSPARPCPARSAFSSRSPQRPAPARVARTPSSDPGRDRA